MSNYHVRNISANGRNASVIFHVPVPAENNSASVSLRTALSQHIKPRNADGTFGTFQSQMQGVLSAELTKLRAGQLFEHVETVKFLAADSDAQKQTKLDNRYTALATNVLNQVRAKLKFWGLNRDI